MENKFKKFKKDLIYLIHNHNDIPEISEFTDIIYDKDVEDIHNIIFSSCYNYIKKDGIIENNFYTEKSELESISEKINDVELKDIDEFRKTFKHFDITQRLFPNLEKEKLLFIYYFMNHH